MSDQKIQLVTEIGQLETAITQAESNLREKQAALQSAKGNRTAGAVALLIGLLLFLFLSSAWFLGAFLSLIGLLTMLTAINKQNNLQTQIQTFDHGLASLRGELATKHAQLSIVG